MHSGYYNLPKLGLTETMLKHDLVCFGTQSV